MQINSKRPSRSGLSPAKPTSASAPVRKPIGPRLETFDLIERVVALEHKHVALEVLADAVLSPFLDVFGTSTGALLLYHVHDGTLTLAASRGLSAAGQQNLEILRPGAVGAWEIPLHGLLNRKAYVIEQPHQHPFVPELVARERGTITNLASIPLYRGSTPVGVLLAIADRRPISETEIFTHVLAYDVLALALDSGLRARASHMIVTPAAVDATPGAALVCEEWQDPNEVARALQGRLEASEHERESLLYRVSALENRLTDTNATLEAERGDAMRSVADRVASMEEQLARERASFEQQLTAARAAAEEQLATWRAGAARDLAATQEAANEEIAAARDAAARELSEAREGAARQIGSTRGSAEKTIADLRASVAAREAALAEKLGTLAKREATLAEQGQALVALADERDRARRAAIDAGDLVRRLNAEIEGHKAEAERAQRAHGVTQTEATARARRGEMLAAELAELHGRRSHLGEVLGDPEIDPIVAVRALQTRVAALDAETSALTAARSEHEQRAAADAQAAEHRLATLRRELEETEAAQRRQLAELQAAYRREMDATQTAHDRELDSARVAHERGRTAERAAAERTIATVRAESESAIEASRQVAERLAAELEEGRHEITTLREERAAIRASLDDPTADPAQAIVGLRTRQAALQSEFATLHARASELEDDLDARMRRDEETRAAHRVEIDERDTAERHARETLEERHRTTLEALHGEHREALHAAQGEAEHTLTRAIGAETEREALRSELTRVRAEAARLREDRERVLAAMDDPDSEPAAVIRALRDQVSALETQIGGFGEQVSALSAGRTELEARSAAAERAAEQRLAAARAELEEARRREHADAEALRRRERDDHEAAHRHAIEELTAAHQRALAESSATRQRELAERSTSHRHELESAEAAHAEVLARATAARCDADALATELERVRAEATRLREERERVLAAVDDPQSEPATLIRALRAELATLEGRLVTTAAERADLERRAASEADALARGSSLHERETGELRVAHARELDDVRAAHQRELESARANAERAETARLAVIAEQSALAERLAVVERERDMLAIARQAAEAEGEQWSANAAVPADGPASTQWTVETVAMTAPARSDAGAPLRPMAKDAGAADARKAVARGDTSEVEPSPDLVQVGAHRFLERDPALRDAIAAALESKLAKTAIPLVVANVLAAVPDRLDELDGIARTGAIVVGYATETDGRSRLLGPVRWFNAPPSPEDAVAALGDLRGVRRVITLSDDIDAFIPAKTALTRAGHSVSMACDTKQALDLLTMLKPQAVLVDLRAAPDAVAHFLDALELENGDIVSMLVLGAGGGRVLKRVLERLLRPRTVIPAEVVAMCRGALAGPPPAKNPNAPPHPLRPVERVTTVVAPPAARKSFRRGTSKMR
jgi:chromosome segregation ATPase